jgi:enamine deaminase RidA (YjgF/YER057c/UK114 family)
MGETEKRLMELGIVLPDSPAPLANYVSVQRADNILYLSGSGPISAGRPTITGRLGENVTLEQGYAAAREAGLNLIATLKKELGELDRVEQIVKLLGFVSSTNDFYAQPAVINGASDLLVEVFGARGQHARSALGTNVLPFNIPVEVEIVVKVR